MRDLTGEEFKLAPDWATHYFIDSDDDVIYESESLCWWVELNEPMVNLTFDAERSSPIIKKPFDITKHEFGGTVEDFEFDGCELTLYCGYDFRFVELCKDDAIAIAKALGVTGEDLK